MTNISTLRPGLLVSLSCSLRGNVSYAQEVIDPEHLNDDGATEAEWKTKRTVADAAEYEAGKKARAKTRSVVSAVCVKSAFGLLCPEIDAEKLTAAIAEAHKVADDFNATAKLSRVRVYVIAGRIASDDVEAAKAIASEVNGLLANMEQGVKNMDVEAIRAAASQAKQMGAMLSPENETRVRMAIEAARATASTIAKAGEQAAISVDQATLRRIAEARTAFLDLDDAKAIAAPQAKAAALDLTPDAPIKAAAPAPATIEME